MIVKSNTSLSKGNVSLYIRDDQGRIVNPSLLTYSVVSQGGSYSSGLDRPGLLNDDGSYYISWNTPNKSGPFVIIWKYRLDNRLIQTRTDIFVLNPDDVNRKNELVGVNLNSSVSKTFLVGSNLGQNDLRIIFRNNFGVFESPFSVFWTIFFGDKPITKRTVANPFAVGQYYADWRAEGKTGDYKIVWEWCDTAVDPLKSKNMSFSLINPQHPSTDYPTSCDCSCDCNMPICNCSCNCQSYTVDLLSDWYINEYFINGINTF